MSSVQDFQPPTADEMRLHRPLSGENAQTDKASVEQIEVNGRRYLVFPLIAAREMVLDYPENGTRELLPARHLQESVSLWDGTPITFVHPENERRTADDPREYTQTIIGQAYQPKIKDKEKLQVMAYIDVEKANDFGGLAATVVEKLKNGEELGVSAGYATLNDDPSGGVFNGTEYDIEQGYIIPDHIAVFPNDEFKARCDWEDGCGAPRTNYVCDQQPELSESGEVVTNILDDEDELVDLLDTIDLFVADVGPQDDPTILEFVEWLEAEHGVGLPDGQVADIDVTEPLEALFAGTASTRWMPVTENQRTVADQHKDRFEDEAAAEVRAAQLGCDGTHEHPDDGDVMPCESHSEYEEALEAQRENRVTACDVEENYDVDRPAAESVRTLVNEYRRSDSLADFKDRLNGDEPLGVTNVEEVYAMFESKDEQESEAERENIPAESESYTLTRSGEYVVWDTGRERQHGQIVAVAEDGCLEIDGRERCVDADNPTRIVQVQHYADDGEIQERQSLKLVRMDAPNEDNLRSWNAPKSARVNMEEQEDPATLFQRFLSSIGYDKQNAAGAEELMDDVENSVDTDESDTTEEAEDTEPTDEAEPTEETTESDETDESDTDVDEATEETDDTEESTETETEDTESDVDETVDETDTESETEDEVADEGGEDSVEETDTDGGNTSDTKQNMEHTKENQADDLDLEDIAAKTAFGVSELEEMDDTMLSALERTVQEMAGDDYDAVEDAEGEEESSVSADHDKGEEYRNTENNEAEAETENTVDENESTETESEETTINTDEFLTQEQAEEQFASSEDVEEVNENIEQIKGMVQNIQTEQESEETEQKARMVANAIDGMSVEAAKSLPEDELDTLVETHGTRTNYGAVPGQMERGGVNTTNTQGEDPDDYPAGGRSAWQESKAAEGGD